MSSNAVFQPRKQSAPVLRTLSILLYGVPKVGKTTEAAKFPSAVLLNCEPSGTDLLKGEHDVYDVPSLDALAGIMGAVAASQYKTIVLDGFTWLINQAAREKVAAMGEKNRLRAYALITEQVQRILGDVLRSGKIVVATGHSRLVDIDEEQEGKVEVRPDINPRLSDGVFGLFSVIAYCYPTDKGSMMLTKPLDNDKRRILAGDRSGILPKTMALSAAGIMEALRQTQPQKSTSETGQGTTPPAGASSKKGAATPPAQPATTPTVTASQYASAETIAALAAAAHDLYGEDWQERESGLAEDASVGTAKTFATLTEKEAQSLLETLRQAQPSDADPTLWTR